MAPVSEEAWLERIRQQIPEEGDVPGALVAVADQALDAFPRSMELWLLRGHLILLGDDDPRRELEDARQSYERALEIAPDDPEPHNELGYWYDVWDEQLELALSYFERAVDLGGDHEAHFGRARVLAELNQPERALASLDPPCPYAKHPEILELAKEIRNGGWARDWDPEATG